MSLRKFQIIVTNIQEYMVEIDDDVYNEEWAKEFAEVFWNIDEDDKAKGAAIDIARQTMIQGTDMFIEGFGIIPVKDSTFSEYLRDKGEKMAKGVTIEVIGENDFETEVFEIEEGGAK